jgi:hypothetical protein
VSRPAWEQARDVERIARRVAEEHPDPEARRVYAWIAERAAAKREAIEGGVS